jgi:hypothetical protein
LLVSDGDDLGVENHLVHVFDIVEVFVELFLSFGEESFSLVFLSNLPLFWLDLRSSLLVHFEHLGLAGL